MAKIKNNPVDTTIKRGILIGEESIPICPTCLNDIDGIGKIENCPYCNQSLDWNKRLNFRKETYSGYY